MSELSIESDLYKNIYDISFVCTYKLINTEDEYDAFDLEEMAYRTQLLQAFGIKNLVFEDDIINSRVDAIYTEIINLAGDNANIIRNSLREIQVPPMFEIFKDLSNDPLAKFRLLFRYECFDFTHKFLVKLFKDQIFEIKEWKKLLQAYVENV